MPSVLERLREKRLATNGGKEDETKESVKDVKSEPKKTEVKEDAPKSTGSSLLQRLKERKAQDVKGTSSKTSSADVEKPEPKEKDTKVEPESEEPSPEKGKKQAVLDKLKHTKAGSEEAPPDVNEGVVKDHPDLLEKTGGSAKSSDKSRCEYKDSKKRQCVKEVGHEGKHWFNPSSSTSIVTQEEFDAEQGERLAGNKKADDTPTEETKAEELPVETTSEESSTAEKVEPESSFSTLPSVSDEGGRLLVTRHFTKAGELITESSSEHVIQVGVFDVAPAHVTANRGLTINTGDYNSVKLSVQVTVPCYTEEIDGAYEFAKKSAEEKLVAEVDKIDKK